MHAPRFRRCQLLESLESRMLLSSVSVDPSFGTGGHLDIPLSGNVSRPSVVCEPDGRLFAAVASATSTEVDLFRFDANGVLDSSFGTQGKIAFNVPGDTFPDARLALQSDGSIIILAN